MDEKNAQQFVEQLGPGKRPLWAVPVLLRLARHPAVISNQFGFGFGFGSAASGDSASSIPSILESLPIECKIFLCIARTV